MAEKKKLKKKVDKRVERRFEPDSMQISTAAAGAGFLGCAALGVGVYGQWIREYLHQMPLEASPYIVAGGAVVLGGALWFGDSAALAVRVGDAGVALEKGSEMQRLAWCDIDRIAVDGKRLVLKGEDATLAVPIAVQKRAVAWILSEAARRVPKALDVKPSAVDTLPKPKDTDGQLVDVEGVQVAGRHCAASDKPIAFEKDARLCPNCAQVYWKDSVPKKCVSCDSALAGNAVAP